MKNLFRTFLLFTLFFFITNLYSQSEHKLSASFDCEQLISSSDCANALIIKANGKINFTCTPDGFGEELEIKNNSPKSVYFEKEHNTVWLKFKALKDGFLAFKLVPNNFTYDYDYTLFKTESDSQCERIINKSIQPIRANNSRNNKDEMSVTGLSMIARSDFVPSGIGNHLSKAIKVVKGELFMLVIDNVYKGNEGFSLRFEYLEVKTIEGEIRDEQTGEPIKANVTWENKKTGEILATTTSNPIDGKFKLEAPVYVNNPNAEFTLSTYINNYFFKEIFIKTKDIETIYTEPIKIVLPKLEKGKKMRLHNINFHGDLATIYPTSKPSLKRLKKLMKLNPSLNILIEGHTNGLITNQIEISRSQILSEQRAEAVKSYLMENNISDKRIRTIGYNSSRMLFPEMRNLKETHQNRRVEILVTGY